MAARRTERFSVVLAAIDKVSAPVRKINRRIESMVAPVKKVARAMRSLTREAGFGKLGTALSGVGRQFARLGLIGGAALGGLFVAVKKVGEAADEIQKLSDQTGAGVEALQELEFAAGQTGVSSSVFRQSIGALAKRVGELKAGTGALGTLLGKVDPRFRDLLARSTSTEEAFGLLVEKIGSLEDPLKKSALAAAAFSRSGLTMVNLANQGSEGIEELRETARRLGFVLDSETTQAAAEMRDRLTETTLTIKGLATIILSDLFPVVSEIASEIAEWTVQNRELIKTNATAFLKEFVAGGRAFLGLIREWLPPIVEVVKRFGGMKLVLGVIAATVLAPLVVSIVAVGAALTSTAGLVIAAGVAIGALIAGIVASWDQISAAFFSVMDPIIETIDGLIDTASTGAAAVRGFFGLGDAPALAAAGGTSVAGESARLAGLAPPPASSSRLAVRIDVDQEGRVVGTKVDAGPESELDLEEGGTIGREF